MSSQRLRKRKMSKKVLQNSKILLDKKVILDKLFKEEEGKSYDTSNLTQEEIIKRIRKTRNQLWEEKYKKLYKD